jgi:plasma-membrane calcium-translocating P-type ATPase
MKPYIKTVQEVITELNTDIKTGLSTNEAALRLEKYGPNQLVGKKSKNFFQRFIDQLRDVMVIVLLIAAVISFVIAIVENHGEFIDSIIILVIVFVNAMLGVVQESNAEKSLEALKNMSAPSATVIRDGKTIKIPSSEVVPGDVFILEAGDLIPSDARLVECASLKSEESALTGESVPVDKDINVEIADDAPLGDRLNMVYSGCNITYGRGVAIATGTGMETEMGKIAGLLNETEDEETPLQEKLDRLGKQMGLIALGICVFIFILGLFKGEKPAEMFMTAVSLAVAAIPEGLTTVVTLVLATGVQKMVKENAIIRRLPAVETLGSTSVICSDKTGTLTQNKMTVKKVWAAGGELEDMTPNIDGDTITVITYNALCNDSSIEKDENGKIVEIGDPTETALIAAAESIGLKKRELVEQYPRLGEIPFDSERKLMTTVHNMGGKIVAIVKGGYDVLLPRCIAGDTSRADEMNLIMGTNALRVLAVGYRVLDEVPTSYDSESLEKDLTFVGLVGMIDPPREESKEAIAICKEAGIKTVMITGDHVITASAIAKELGILENESEAISGIELAAMDEETLRKNIRNYSVYARVSPEDKIRIVQAWQSQGEVVAMTGDGVNDAPALKAADIGCAMGITGTEVAKGAAEMVLTDDNFSTIVSSVKEGRSIYDNIKKTIEYLLGANIGEVFVVFVAMLFDWGTPLIATQLLMVNVVTDAFPAFALGFEKPDNDIMQRKPIPRSEGVFANGLGTKIIFQGLMIGSLALTSFYLGKFVLGTGTPEHAESVGRTMAFLTLTLSQLVHSNSCRTRESLFKKGFFSNPQMNLAFLLSLTITLLVTLVPALEEVFRMVDLTGQQWAVVVGLSLSTFVFVEIGKFVTSRKK